LELSVNYKDADQNTIKDKILSFCRESMAAFKAPKHIHFIDAIPLTPVGKIDKKALR
jgi:long-chain acyl-CoA synthetase